MHLLITDSGVGGLSVCAQIERFLRTHGTDQPTRLTYVNAAPENDFGYNAMATRAQKVATFDRFLHIVAARYAPDAIYVACNTLSVLMHETSFLKNQRTPVEGIVATGVRGLIAELKRAPDCTVLIFGTATTIDAGTYPAHLMQRGIVEDRIVSQACPHLADTISEDRQGHHAAREIDGFVGQAVGHLGDVKTPLLAYLACTHYGYRKACFEDAFRRRDMMATILNPNELVVADLFPNQDKQTTDAAPYPEIQVEVISRYRIPETALETLDFFLRDVSPKTAAAVTHFVHAPTLF